MNFKKRKKIIIIGVAFVAVFVCGLWLVSYYGSYSGDNLPSDHIISTSTATTTATSSPEIVPVDKDITLAVGQEGKVGGLSIRLNSFVQDSRCPIDVVCIQAGAVNVNVTLTDRTHYITKNFPSDEVPYSFGNYRISIVDIAPPRENQKEILSSQYRITFHVSSVIDAAL